MPNLVWRWRLAIIILPLLAAEALCRAGLIDRITMPPPSVIATDLLHLLASGRFNGALVGTLSHVAEATLAAILVGVIAGVLVHRVKPLRAVLEPLFATYYAIPIYAFYPLMIVVFGLGDLPQVLIGFMLAVIAVIVSTLNGLDAVPAVMARTARLHRLGLLATSRFITLPYAALHIFTGAKLAVGYAFIGVIGAEFIMSRTGIGFEIRFAFDNFDNATMYPLIVLVLAFAIAVNLGLDRWERALMSRRARA